MAQQSELKTHSNTETALPQALNPASNYSDDEIDLAELFSALMKRKWLIISMSFGFAILAAAYSFTLKNQYKAEVLLAPASSGSSSGSMSKLAGQFGGLASLAGISLPGGGGGLKAEALAVLQSRQFLTHYIKKNNLKPILFYEKWDKKQQAWVVPPRSLIVQAKEALLGKMEKKVFLPGREILQEGEPSLLQAYAFFSKLLSVSEDKKNGMTTLSIEWESPLDAQQWANDLVVALNERLRQEAIAKTETSIEYLQRQLALTSNVELRNILFSLIEDNTKSITLAKTTSEYVFKVIDPAVVPERKSKPKRALIVAVGFILGLVLGGLTALILNMRDNKSSNEHKG